VQQSHLARARVPPRRQPPGSLRIVAGAELVRGYTPPGGGYEKQFCSVCGSALFSRDPTDPTQVGVRLGALDGDPGIGPSLRQYVASWEPIPDDALPRHPERWPG
jgi:hypothetical protein